MDDPIPYPDETADGVGGPGDDRDSCSLMVYPDEKYLWKRKDDACKWCDIDKDVKYMFQSVRMGVFFKISVHPFTDMLMMCPIIRSIDHVYFCNSLI